MAQRWQADELRDMARRLLKAAGTPDQIAAAVAAHLADAELTGHPSHGVLRIPYYLKSIEEGKLDPDAEPELVRESAGALIIDGKNGFGHYVARCAMERVIAKAADNDVCGASLVHMTHIGRLGAYAEQAARAGCIGLAMVGVGGRGRGPVVPFGGALGVMGTNPIAVGVPAGDTSAGGDEVPFVLDFATTVVAQGKIQVARSKATALPAGAILDKHGQPTVSPDDYFDGGFMLPFGGHKGYGLALLTCLLCGLSGEFNTEHDGFEGAFMQAINISAFTPLERYRKNVRAFLDVMKSTPAAPGFDEVLVPGDFEHRNRTQQRVDGIEVPDPIWQELREWAEKLNVDVAHEAS